MHRVFCAVTEEFEAERQEFYKLIGDFNEKEAAVRGVLFVAVSIMVSMNDKRPFQSVIDENIQACSYYVQVLENNWGPPRKNFEKDWALATACGADPDLPMQEVVAMRRKPNEAGAKDLGLVEPLEFSTMEDYREQWWRLLSRWLEQIAPR